MKTNLHMIKVDIGLPDPMQRNALTCHLPRQTSFKDKITSWQPICLIQIRSFEIVLVALISDEYGAKETFWSLKLEAGRSIRGFIPCKKHSDQILRLSFEV